MRTLVLPNSYTGNDDEIDVFHGAACPVTGDPKTTTNTSYLNKGLKVRFETSVLISRKEVPKNPSHRHMVFRRELFCLTMQKFNTIVFH